MARTRLYFSTGDGNIDTCAEGLACDSEGGTCGAIAFGALGATCDDATLRRDRGWCGYEGGKTGTCVRYIPVGSPCDDSNVHDRCEGLAECPDGVCRIVNPNACK